jgi:hypothetical protein
MPLAEGRCPLTGFIANSPARMLVGSKVMPVGADNPFKGGSTLEN